MSVLWNTPCGVTLMNARRVTLEARIVSPRVDGFVAARRARKASTTTEKSAVIIRRLRKPAWVVCFFFISKTTGAAVGLGGTAEWVQFSAWRQPRQVASLLVCFLPVLRM